MNARRPDPAALLVPLAVESVGTLLAAAGVLLVFAPEVAHGLLPASLAGALTPAVGWTALAVGLLLSAVGTWRLIGVLRERQRQRPVSR